MNKRSKSEVHRRKLMKHTWLIIAAWSLILGGLLVCDLSTLKQATQNLAIGEARTHFTEYETFRLWASTHGGFYVPTDERTPPSPYLAHIPERDIETPSGVQLTLMNPAYALRQMNEEFTETYGVVGHITSLRPLRPENAPDYWEHLALESFENGTIEVIEFTEFNEQPFLRLMQPLIVQEDCFKCHADQDYDVGDVCGGISISLPLDAYLIEEKQATRTHILLYTLLWILGIGVIIQGSRVIKQKDNKRKYAQKISQISYDQLEIRVRERTAELANTNKGLQAEIAERVRMENALRESEEKHRELIETTSEGFWLLDPEKKTIDVNQSLCDMLGYSRNEMIGKTPMEFVDAENESIFIEQTSKISSTLHRAYEISLRKKDGINFPTLFNATSLIDNNGKPAGAFAFVTDITDRELMEESLRESETRFRELFENMDSGVAVYRAINDGEDFIFTDFNRSGEKIEKVIRDEIIGKRVTEAFPRIKDSGLFEVFQRVWRTGEPEHHPIYFYENTNLTDWRENFIYKLPSGEIVAIYSDETERKQMEEKLQGSEERFKKLSDLTFEGILIHDKGVAIDINESLIKLFGYTRKEMIGKNIIELCVVREHHATILENITHYVANPYEVMARKKDGTLFPIEIEAREIKSEEEEFRVAAIRDITERKRVEAALLKSEEKYRSFVDTATDLMIITDKNGTFTDVNKAMIEILGYSREELTGMHITQIITEEAQENDFKPNWGKFIEDGKINLDTTFLTKNGDEIPGELKAIAVFDVSGNIVGSRAVISDLTERVQAEEELKKHRDHLEELVTERTQELHDTQDKLIRHERLAALGQMAGGIGHELRNPLSIITNAIYYLKMTLPDVNEKTAKYLEMIDSETRSAAKIISDLLDFARVKVSEHEDVSISELISDMLTKHPPPTNVEVNIHIPNDLPSIYIDPAQIVQVLVNLFANAYQAMPDGGDLTVTSEQSIVPSLQSSFFIAISDTGVGIPPENMEKIFEPLFTTKDKGIGLGLVISKILVEANNGSIKVESMIGEGTTFTLLFPAEEMIAS